MILGVVGNGVVGKAVANGFRKRLGAEVLVNDSLPSRSTNSKKELMEKCSHIFICVPTPPNRKGSLDIDPLSDAVEELIYARPYEAKPPIIVVKSTVPPNTMKALETWYPNLPFAYNPEFLRQDHAEEDFLYPDRIIIGTTDKAVEKSFYDLYRDWRCPMFATTPEQAEMIKLLSNAYLIYKVAFGLEAERLCNALAVPDPRIVLKFVGADRRIGLSHLDPSLGKIPVHSPCLPKDMKALLSAAPSDLFGKAYEVAVE